MLYYLLAFLCLISFIFLATLLGWQVRVNRRNNLDYHGLTNLGTTSLVIDYFAFKIVRGCEVFGSKIYLFLIHFLKNSISLARYLLVRVERRFNLFVAGLPDKKGVHKSDKMSFFLKEIKEHKDNVMAELQSEALAEEVENK